MPRKRKASSITDEDKEEKALFKKFKVNSHNFNEDDFQKLITPGSQVPILFQDAIDKHAELSNYRKHGLSIIRGGTRRRRKALSRRVNKARNNTQRRSK
jgi:hypothetical protein